MKQSDEGFLYVLARTFLLLNASYDQPDIYALKHTYLPSGQHVLGTFRFADEKVTGNYNNLK